VHELALCTAIARIVVHRADERPVTAVHLRIGELRQVVPASLEFCWAMTTANTELAGARLDVERVAAQLRCSSCGEISSPRSGTAVVCAACGSFATELLAGEEFDVVALDVAVA
jgi:hydrogenase nickel incorporation protein HypA/HybF